MLLGLPHFTLQGVKCQPLPLLVRAATPGLPLVDSILPHPWAEMPETLLALGFAEVSLLHLTFLWRRASSGGPGQFRVLCPHPSALSIVY